MTHHRFDLDPADMAARVNFRHGMRTARIDAGLSTEAVSRLAGFDSVKVVYGLERHTSWEAWRAQQWARGLNRVLRLPIVGLAVPADDVAAMVLKATTAFGARDEDDLHLRIVAHDLYRTRVAMGVSRSEMARRCGVTEGAIGDWEEQPETSLLRLFQRYARALGAAVVPDLRHVPSVVAS